MFFLFWFIMNTLLVIALIVLGLIFVGAVLLQSPKGWLGVALGGASAGGDYGSKKSLETTLKNVARVSGSLFVLVAILLPYVG